MYISLFHIEGNFKTRSCQVNEIVLNNTFKAIFLLRTLSLQSEFIAVFLQIQSLRRDKQLEPFIDVSVGGYEIPNQPQGHICVWAISILNQVYICIYFSQLYATRTCIHNKELTFHNI